MKNRERMETRENEQRTGFCRLPHNFGEGMGAENRARMMAVFAWLVSRATFTDYCWNGIPLRRGQVCFTVGGLATYMGLSISETRWTLNRLYALGMITKENANLVTNVATNQCTIVTICEYDSYAGSGDTPATNLATNVVTNQTTNIKQENIKQEKMKEEEKEEERPSSSSSEGSALEKRAGDCVRAADSAQVPLASLASVMLADREWAEGYEGNHELTPQQMNGLLGRFVRHLQDMGVKGKSPADARRHFVYWHRRTLDRREAERRQMEEQQRMAAERSRQRMDEEQEYRRSEAERRQREERERERRIKAELRAAAERGDERARQLMTQYGLW